MNELQSLSVHSVVKAKKLERKRQLWTLEFFQLGLGCLVSLQCNKYTWNLELSDMGY